MMYAAFGGARGDYGGARETVRLDVEWAFVLLAGAYGNVFM